MKNTRKTIMAGATKKYGRHFADLIRAPLLLPLGQESEKEYPLQKPDYLAYQSNTIYPLEW